MNNIDKIFSKLKSSEVEAPNLWSKLETQLTNSPKGKSPTISTLTKFAYVAVASGIIGIGTFLIIDNIRDTEKAENTIEIQVQTVEPNASHIDLNNEKTIDYEDAKQIVNTKTTVKSNQIKENIRTVFDVRDEGDIDDVFSENTDYSIKNINTEETFQSEIAKIDYISEDTLDSFEKILPEESTIPEFKASNVITPNGDGINDEFYIKDVDKFPDNSLIIVDQNGRSVYRCRGYKNNFNAINIPLGTYYYKFEYDNLGRKESRKGSITVM